MEPRLIITRENGGYALDTNIEEDSHIMITVIPAMRFSNFITLETLNAALEKYFKGTDAGATASPEYYIFRGLSSERKHGADAGATASPEYWRSTCMVEKDAEIARLKDELGEALAQPHYPDGPWDMLHKCTSEKQKLRDRIADLEKLCDMQKATMETQGKILQEMREKTLQDVWGKCYDEMNMQSRHRTHYDPEDPYIPSLECGEIMIILESLGLKQPAQKPPEPCDLCHGVGTVTRSWQDGLSGGVSHGTCPDCKGTGKKGLMSEPEMFRCPKGLKKCPSLICEDYECKYKESAYTCSCPVCQKRNNQKETTKDPAQKAPEPGIYPGMAKDIGDLILRVEAMEKTLCECPVTMEQRISELETSLKALQEEVKAIPRVYYSSGPIMGSGSTGAWYPPYQRCQKVFGFNRQSERD